MARHRRIEWQRELQEFYRKQGLTGNALRKALLYDIKAARRNSSAYWPNLGLAAGDIPLGGLFIWRNSPEGHRYWSARAMS